MTKLDRNGVNISAFCPNCSVVTSFNRKDVFSWEERFVFSFHQCSGCARGGMAKIQLGSDPSKHQLLEFFPLTIESLSLPIGVPDGVVSEFREAELCMGSLAYRAASALFRSALEKVLEENGYSKKIDQKRYKDLKARIDAAAEDGLINRSLQKRAHSDIREFGNDIFHEPWCLISLEEADAAHRYCQRIIVEFYDHRPSVKESLDERDKKLAKLKASSTP